MSLPVRPIASPSLIDQSRCKILQSRDQYRACHVRVPDSDDRLAAIVVSDRYYSFFKVVKEPQKALQIAAKLVYRGDEVVITHTIKGDAIWIYETQACESKLKSTKPEPQLISELGLWRILESERDYQPCQIRVPNLAKPLMAICVDHQYFSLLRAVSNQTQAISLADRLANKGHATRITKNGAWAVWVLESEASI